ncbi:hypothetical protein KSS87_017906 [Heliosperma pusillum]|nr:hypothetical protein KSS87_017906 [Heliosperma pusillum]
MEWINRLVIHFSAKQTNKQTMALLQSPLSLPSILLPKISPYNSFPFISTVQPPRLPTLILASIRMMRTTPFIAQVQGVQTNVELEDTDKEWGKVSAVLFDMDGVLCDSEEPSRRAAVDVFAEMGVHVTVDDFIPFMGTGEANFLGGVAQAKGVEGFDTGAAKKRFFEIYIDKYAKPDSGIGFPGALELITQCKDKGLKVAVASSADRIKVDANLAAAGLPLQLFDAIVSADAFEKLKPAPDIFISASKILVIEDALAGLQAAKAAKMRCIVVATTLSEERLATEAPSLIRKDIGNITLNDIIRGGSGHYNEKSQASPFLNTLTQTGAMFEGEANKSFSFLGLPGGILSNMEAWEFLYLASILPFQTGSYGSCFDFAGNAICITKSSLEFNIWSEQSKPIWSNGGKGIVVDVRHVCSITHVAVWLRIELQLGINPSLVTLLVGNSHSGRVQQFVSYISDLESRGNDPIVPEFPSRLDWLNSAPLQFQRVKSLSISEFKKTY